MKRRLALLMVLVMLVGLVPMNVFASENKISTTPTVTEDWDFLENANAPTFRIEETDGDDFDSVQTFTLELKNAEWSTETDAAFTDVANGFDVSSGSVVVTATYIDSKNVEIQVIDGDAGEQWFKIPMIATVQDAGTATVTITGESTVTEGEYTFAKVAAGDTKVTYSADDVDAFSDTDTLGTLKLEELAIGTIDDNGEIRLRLTNSDFSWETVPTATFGNGFNGQFTLSNGTLENDQTVLYTVTSNTASARGYISFKAGVISADSDATYGDVKLKVYGTDLTTETITVAKYSDYAVTVESDEEGDDINTIYAGYINATEDAGEKLIDLSTTTNVTQDDDDSELSLLLIKEDVAGTLDDGKRLKVELPEWVNIMDVVVDTDESSNVTAGSITLIEGTADDTGNDFEFVVTKTDPDDKYELALKLFVTVEADAKGDIEATVTGKAMNGETKKVVIGKAVAPVTMAVEVKDVKIGLNDQAVGKITITEATDGILDKGEFLMLNIDDMNISGSIDTKVTKGDIELVDPETVTIDGTKYLQIEIDNESSEASTIEVTGVEVDLNRSIAEGTYDINLMGSAVVMNNDGNGDYFFFDNDTMASAPYARVITPAPGDTQAGEKVVFTIGSADYMIGAVKVTSDVAPYINENGRTMLPLRALANALGVVDTNIMWNEVERSVTIFKGDATIKVVIGQMSFVKNGVSVPMDTQAVIMNGRTMLPLRAIGQALGAEVTWDEATRTVTVQ